MSFEQLGQVSDKWSNMIIMKLFTFIIKREHVFAQINWFAQEQSSICTVCSLLPNKGNKLWLRKLPLVNIQCVWRTPCCSTNDGTKHDKVQPWCQAVKNSTEINVDICTNLKQTFDCFWYFNIFKMDDFTQLARLRPCNSCWFREKSNECFSHTSIISPPLHLLTMPDLPWLTLTFLLCHSLHWYNFKLSH